MQRKVSIVPIGQERLGVLALSVGQCWPTTNYDQSPAGGKFGPQSLVCCLLWSPVYVLCLL